MKPKFGLPELVLISIAAAIAAGTAFVAGRHNAAVVADAGEPFRLDAGEPLGPDAGEFNEDGSWRPQSSTSRRRATRYAAADYRDYPIWP